jgi:hypothetical protein
MTKQKKLYVAMFFKIVHFFQLDLISNKMHTISYHPNHV